MKSLPERLREATDCRAFRDAVPLLREAADEIEELRAALACAIGQDRVRPHDPSQAFEGRRHAQELERLQSANRWIPVAERLPEHSQRVLAFVGGEARLVRWGIKAAWFDNWMHATHWQPLPEPPAK